MKKIMTFTLALTTILFVTACGGNGVSQEEYDRALKELSRLQESNSTNNNDDENKSNPKAESQAPVSSDNNSDFSNSDAQSWYDEFISYTSTISYPIKSAHGITDNGLVFWERYPAPRMNNGVVVYNTATNNTHFLSVDGYGGGINCYYYYDNDIYSIVLQPEISERSLIRRDLQGNIIDEYAIYRESQMLGFRVLADGSAFHKFGWDDEMFILSSDFITEIKIPPQIVDIGHGKTDEIPWGSVIGEYNGIYYTHSDSDRSLYSLDIKTGEQNNLNIYFDYEPEFYGKYFLVQSNSGQWNVINLDTGETVGSLPLPGRHNFQFTGFAFYTTDDKYVNKFYSHGVSDDGMVEGEFRIVLEMPNSSILKVLNDEIVLVEDDTGTYLYRIIEGNTAGELITEIDMSFLSNYS